MKSPQDRNSIPPEMTERLQFLLSRQLDGDVASEDALELAEIQQDESLNWYSASIHQIRQQLTALPVKQVPPSFLRRIHQAILDDSAKSRASAVASSPRGWTQRVVVSASIAACALGLMIVLQSGFVNDSHQVALETSASSAHHESAVAARVAIEDSAGGLGSAERTESSLASNLTQQEESELRPFLESDDWRIVVVQVNSKDREDIMRDIETIVAKNDMDIRTVVEPDDTHESRFGILLTSAVFDEKDFIDSMVPQADAESTDWNAQHVAESSRESLIRRLQESLKTPTYSELHFGQVYVALPKRSDFVDVADQKLVAQNNVTDKNALPGPMAKRIAASPGKSPSSALPEPRKPVLVVFEFTDPASEQI